MFSGGLPITAFFSERTMGRSINLGYFAIAAIISLSVMVLTPLKNDVGYFSPSSKKDMLIIFMSIINLLYKIS